MRPDTPPVESDAREDSDAPASALHDRLIEWRARGWRRWRVLVVAEAVLWAAGLGILTLALTGHTVVALVVGVAVGLWRLLADARARDVRTMLQASEVQWPTLDNALIAWHEIERGTLAAAPASHDRVARQAHAVLAPATWPHPRGRREWALAVVTLGIAMTLTWALPWLRSVRDAVTPDPTSASLPASGVASAAVGVRYRITPPAYTRRPHVDLAHADLLDALVGSRLDALFDGVPDAARAQFSGTDLPLSRDDGGTALEMTVTTSGLLTVTDAAGRPLIATAVQAVPDRAPLVRIHAPGQDIRTGDLSRRIPVEVEASDDIGLTSVRVRYTHVTGGGESFEFVDGELPVDVSRAAEAWRARGTLDLTALGMAPGDSLVYWAVARDGRLDDAGVAESERYLVEIPRPGQLAGGDFSLPETENRYALSQRMIIQLTEALRDRRPRLPADEYAQEAQALAIQQRRVRAEFVFLMGGDVVDEVEEAEHSHEIEAGRLANSGQQELLDAVRQMAQAEQRLTDADVDAALPFEYRALEALQAAFGKARYFMRTLPVAVAIDQSRRGSGDLTLAAGSTWTRAPLAPGLVADGRRALVRLLTLTPAAGADEVTAVTEALLALDATGPEWLRAVQTLATAYGADVTADERRRVLDATASALRERLAAASPHLVLAPLPVNADEAALPAAGGRQ